MTLYFKSSISEDLCANILALNRIRQQLFCRSPTKKTLVLGGVNMVSA